MDVPKIPAEEKNLISTTIKHMNNKLSVRMKKRFYIITFLRLHPTFAPGPNQQDESG